MQCRVVHFALLLIAGLSSAAAQQFEVVSIKPTSPNAGIRTPAQTDPGRVVYNGLTAKMLIQIAYKMENWAISGGPDWLESARYDVEATLPAGSTESQVPAMMQALLAERFQLATRRETREMAVYKLMVAKKGPKLKPGDTGEQWKNGAMKVVIFRGGLALHQCSMGLLAGVLASRLGRPVLDETNLNEVYEINLRWAPDDAPPGSSEAERPSLFTAVEEQLGLKLESTKAPVEMLIVTQISKPTAN
jgi:uncharacterized protein (TIGR03435 family)